MLSQNVITEELFMNRDHSVFRDSLAVGKKNMQKNSTVVNVTWNKWNKIDS